MYGLTEAFRSTYLPPEEVDRRPDSIGKAIPNAEILVLREDGTPCAPDEPGELVHRGALVGMGYWNDPEKTAERYKPLPGRDPGLVLPEIAVFSGDTVRMDAEGFLYFIGRRDEMIKTSGYRVSPTEIEEMLYGAQDVGECAAFGVPHPVLGQAIVVVARRAPGSRDRRGELLAHAASGCRPTWCRANRRARGPAAAQSERQDRSQGSGRGIRRGRAMSTPQHPSHPVFRGRAGRARRRRHADLGARRARRPHAVLRLRQARARPAHRRIARGAAGRRFNCITR